MSFLYENNAIKMINFLNNKNDKFFEYRSQI
jgi:hypothetical protein